MPDETTLNQARLPAGQSRVRANSKAAIVEIEKSKDSPRVKAAMVAYQDAMRRCQTWRTAIRLAIEAYEATP